MTSSQPCKVNYFCLGAVLIFLGSILLCALGFTIVLPYQATSHWPATTCHVTNVTLDPHRCACDQHLPVQGENCLMSYPCLVITVLYHKILPPPNTSIESYYQGSAITQPYPLHATSASADGKTLNEDIPSTKTDNKTGSGSYQSGYVMTESQTRYGLSSKDYQHDNSYITNSSLANFTKSPVRPLMEEYAIDNEEEWDEEEELLSSSGEPMVLSEKDILEDTDSPEGVSEVVSAMAATTWCPHTEAEAEYVNVSGYLYRSWSDAFYKEKCALYECGDEEWNLRETYTFRASFANIGQEITCYYDPDNVHMTIMHRTNFQEMLHALLWPSIALFVGASLWAGLFLGCITVGKEGQDVDYSQI